MSASGKVAIVTGAGSGIGRPSPSRCYGRGSQLRWPGVARTPSVNRLKAIKRQMFGRAGFQLLRARGADPNAVVKDTGETPLHAALAGAGETASAADRHAVVTLLVEHGADPNRRTTPGAVTLAFWRDVRTRGETPLHRAAAYASEETVKFLLDAGANKTIRDANGDSPQSWASWHWRPKRLIDLLDPQVCDVDGRRT